MTQQMPDAQEDCVRKFNIDDPASRVSIVNWLGAADSLVLEEREADSMKDAAQRLIEIVRSVHPRLESLAEEDAGKKPYEAKWSRKEILGHLIDSASNNHQRIVRMQEVPDLGSFRYTQDHWVKSQQYQTESWADLVELWYWYNVHLAKIMNHIAPAAMDHVCDVGYPKQVTLRYLLDDYVDHLEHHLGQIFSEGDPRKRLPRIKREI